MIQRIQSLFLLLVAIIQGLFLTLDIYQAEAGTTAAGNFHKIQILEKVNATEETSFGGTTVEEGLSSAIMWVDILVIVLAVVCIFLFRNRPRQLLLTRLTLLLLIAMNGLLFYLIFKLRGNMPAGMTEHFLPGSYISVISIILLALAARGIRKDEILVRSADRLR